MDEGVGDQVLGVVYVQSGVGVNDASRRDGWELFDLFLSSVTCI